MTHIELLEYAPEVNQEALALERACPQAGSLRLRFERSTFHRRAENFPIRRILTARRRGALVGTLAAAIKPGWICGSPGNALFLFDMRVAPEARGCGVAKSLATALIDWGSSRADVGYLYTAAGNLGVARLGELFGAMPSPGFEYVVLPSRGGRLDPGVRNVPCAEAHAVLQSIGGVFDLYTPLPPDGGGGYLRSWLLRRGRHTSVCSAWSNADILAEVVERLPWHLRTLAGVLKRLPAHLPIPAVPAEGEPLRSWYLFDFAATSAQGGRELMRHVRAEAAAAGVDYLYLPHLPSDRIGAALRRDLLPGLSPRIRYQLLIRWFGQRRSISRPYIDVRDL